MGTLTSYVGALDAAKSAENGSAGSAGSTLRLWARITLAPEEGARGGGQSPTPTRPFNPQSGVLF